MNAPSAIMTPLDALKRAIEIAGGQAALARMCDLAQPTVWSWLHRTRQVTPEHVLKVEAATGIPKEDLRPDIYPRDVAPGGAGENATPSRAPSEDEAIARTPDSLSGLTA